MWPVAHPMVFGILVGSFLYQQFHSFMVIDSCSPVECCLACEEGYKSKTAFGLAHLPWQKYSKKVTSKELIKPTRERAIVTERDENKPLASAISVSAFASSNDISIGTSDSLTAQIIGVIPLWVFLSTQVCLCFIRVCGKGDQVWNIAQVGMQNTHFGATFLSGKERDQDSRWCGIGGHNCGSHNDWNSERSLINLIDLKWALNFWAHFALMTMLEIICHIQMSSKIQNSFLFFPFFLSVILSLSQPNSGMCLILIVQFAFFSRNCLSRVISQVSEITNQT